MRAFSNNPTTVLGIKPPIATQVQYAARDIKTPSKPNQIALVAHDVSFVTLQRWWLSSDQLILTEYRGGEHSPGN